MSLTDEHSPRHSTQQPMFTKAERIQQLNDIDKSITKLLQSAGLAIKTLTAYHAQAGQPTKAEPEIRRETFTNATDTYLRSLHAVDVQLKRQILGLEEARIIARERDSEQDKANENTDGKINTEKRSNLDVGWLNSRSGKVERDMEAELWTKARNFLENITLEELHKDP